MKIIFIINLIVNIFSVMINIVVMILYLISIKEEFFIFVIKQ
jgi:hypothetical protein